MTKVCKWCCNLQAIFPASDYQIQRDYWYSSWKDQKENLTSLWLPSQAKTKITRGWAYIIWLSLFRKFQVSYCGKLGHKAYECRSKAQNDKSKGKRRLLKITQISSLISPALNVTRRCIMQINVLNDPTQWRKALLMILQRWGCVLAPLQFRTQANMLLLSPMASSLTAFLTTWFRCIHISYAQH